MEFKQFNELLMEHVKSMTSGVEYLFEVDLSGDELWETYLSSFPDGTNEIFRERREYDCSCCRQFIKSFGNVVAIKGGEKVSVWDFQVSELKFQTVIDAMSEKVKSLAVKDVFMPAGRSFGTYSNCSSVSFWAGHVSGGVAGPVFSFL